LVDVLQAYGDGVTPSEAALLLAISQVGSNEVCLELAPGTWPITANLTTPANLTFRLRRGATFAVSAGVTLDLSLSVVRVEAVTWYSGAGTITVDDTLVAGPGEINSVTFNTAPTGVVAAEGKIWWDMTNATLAVGLAGGSIVQVGNELFARVKNNTGGTLDSGDMVYVSGAQGDRAEVSKAQANAVAPAASLLGMVTQEILDSAEGFVTLVGEVRDVDTSGMVAGDALYLSTSVAGGFTKTQPTDTGGQGNYLVRIGTATKIGASSGIVLLRLSTPIALDPQMTADTDLVSPSQKAVKAYTDTEVDGHFKGGALVYITATQSISDTTFTSINFTSEAYDTDSIHDNSTNNERLTVPAGVIKIRLSLQIGFAANATGGRAITLLKNGGPVGVGGVWETETSPDASWDTMLTGTTGIISVTGGDYFEARVYQTSGGALNVVNAPQFGGSGDPNQTWFAMEILERS
jgi:hypothetical protein